MAQWRYVNTKMNPADAASRGQRADAFLKNTGWIHGPEMIWKSEEEWPQFPTIATIVKGGDKPTDMLITYFSSWRRLKVAVAWFQKLKEALKLLAQGRKELQSTVNQTTVTRNAQKAIDQKMADVKATQGGQTVSLEDLEKAENSIICYIQQQSFPEEMAALQMAPSGVKGTSGLYRLDPVLKEGMLRVGGCLSWAAMPEEMKFPVILPKSSHTSTLILRDIHEKTGHGGRNHILSELRKKYWIIKANSASRKIIGDCVVCRQHRAKIGEQKMADLPQERLQPDLPAFTNVGVDYFGPINVKRGCTTLKRYRVLFTCMTSRAVHIEVANSLDTDSCTNALRRFTCRRGQMKHIRSDNGTNSRLWMMRGCRPSYVKWKPS